MLLLNTPNTKGIHQRKKQYLNFRTKCNVKYLNIARKKLNKYCYLISFNSNNSFEQQEQNTKFKIKFSQRIKNK